MTEEEWVAEHVTEHWRAIAPILSELARMSARAAAARATESTRRDSLIAGSPGPPSFTPRALAAAPTNRRAAGVAGRNTSSLGYAQPSHTT
jgi:hypothetical protein